MRKTQRDRERALELLGLITQTRKQLGDWEAELDGLLPGGRAKSEKKRAAAGGESKQHTKVVEETGTEKNGRGHLTNALRHALPKMSGEFTSRDLISAAGLPEDKVNSGFAAVSRLAAAGKEIKKSATPGKFRRV